AGLTRGTTRGHLARACLEGIALQNLDIVTAMVEDAGRPLERFRVDGGAAANDFLMQLQTDLLDVEISPPHMLETTALGAALLAGLAVGVWRSRAEVEGIWREERRFQPGPHRAAAAALVEQWHAAVSRA